MLDLEVTDRIKNNRKNERGEDIDLKLKRTWKSNVISFYFIEV